MKTRGTEPPMAATPKKTTVTKKPASAAATSTATAIAPSSSTTEAKATPKSVKAAKGPATPSTKLSTPKASVSRASPYVALATEPKLELNDVGETGTTSIQKKPIVSSKPLLKKVVKIVKVVKRKLPTSSLAKASPVKPVVVEEVKASADDLKLDGEGIKAERGDHIDNNPMSVKMEIEELKEKPEMKAEQRKQHLMGEIVTANAKGDGERNMLESSAVCASDAKAKNDAASAREQSVKDKGKAVEGGDEILNDELQEGSHDVLGNELIVEEGADIGEEGGGDDEEGPLEEEERIEILDMAKQRKLKKAMEIFVGGLDRDAVEEDIKMAFKSIGEVVEVRLHKDFVTNKNKGFAFVKFASKEQASRAIAELKNPMIRGKRCGIAPSEDNDTLFLGNICNTWTKEAIKNRLKDYGVEGVGNITFVGNTQNEGLSRGFAFLEFSCHADAMLAYKRLQRPDVLFGHPERTVKVAFAEPVREPDPEVMAQIKSVFIDGLPPYWDEDRVKEQFKEYGEIERVVLARNMPTAKRLDFGFVNFRTHESAISCIDSINNTELGNGKSKMKVRARLSNPWPKSEAVKGGMRGGFPIGRSSVGFYSRFGRGFGRGRFPYGRGGFIDGRVFNYRGRGRGGRRHLLPADIKETSRFGFHMRRPFGARGMHIGGKRGSFRNVYEGSAEEYGPRVHSFSTRGAFDEEHGHFFFDGGLHDAFLARRQSGPFGDIQNDEYPYIYGDRRSGLKRPFSVMEHDPGYFESRSRRRPYYDYLDPISADTQYRDALDPSGNLYSDYYGSVYDDSVYPSDGYYY